MGLPPIAKSARIDAKADGSFEDPRVSGDASVQGVNAGGRKLPELVAKFGLERGTLRLDKLAGPLFGGQIDGHGTVQLWEKRASKPLKSPIVDVKLDLRDIDLATLAQSADLGGPAVAARRCERPARRRHRARDGARPARRSRCSATTYSLGPVEVLLETDKSGKKSEQTATVKALHLKRVGGGSLDIQRQGRPRPPGSRSRRGARQAAARGPARHRDVGRARSAASPARSCTSAAGPIAPS